MNLLHSQVREKDVEKLASMVAQVDALADVQTEYRALLAVIQART
jgi:hypothetical protein